MPDQKQTQLFETDQNGQLIANSGVAIPPKVVATVARGPLPETAPTMEGAKIIHAAYRFANRLVQSAQSIKP